MYVLLQLLVNICAQVYWEDGSIFKCRLLWYFGISIMHLLAGWVEISFRSSKSMD